MKFSALNTVKPLLTVAALFFVSTSARSQNFTIPLPEATKQNTERFTKNAEAFPVTVNGRKEHPVKAYKTSNKEFVDGVILPQIREYRSAIEKLSPREIINVLTLFIFNSYQRYIGNSFYRWGGDILDLDDPQYESIRHTKRYGLDCSGFSTSGYELAVHLKLIPEDSPYALFSSKGLRQLADKTGFKLRGALKGGNNNYRWDTVELNEAGEVVFKLAKGQKPTEEQIAMLQPGDLAGMNGHFGIIVFIDGKPMYLESGGWALSKNNEEPVPAMLGLTLFSNHAAIAIRRAK